MSLSEPHTSESNGGIYYIYICRTSYRLRTLDSSADGISLGQKYYSTILESRALLLSGVYLHRFGLHVLLPMDTATSSRRALNLAQEQEVAEDWRWLKNLVRETDFDMLPLRDFGTKE